jgi:hypothetical protein
MGLISVFELGVSEAYEILSERFGMTDLPPLVSIENEDWGRDYLLSRFLELSPSALAEVGISSDGLSRRRETSDETGE